VRDKKNSESRSQNPEEMEPQVYAEGINVKCKINNEQGKIF